MREHRAMWLMRYDPQRDFFGEAMGAVGTASKALDRAADCERQAHYFRSPKADRSPYVMHPRFNHHWFSAWAALYRQVARKLARVSTAKRILRALSSASDRGAR